MREEVGKGRGDGRQGAQAACFTRTEGPGDRALHALSNPRKETLLGARCCLIVRRRLLSHLPLALAWGSSFSGGDKHCVLSAVPAEEWQVCHVAWAFPVPPPRRVILFLLLS